MRALPILATALVLATVTAALADPARDAILEDYLRQARAADPGFTGFSPERGAAFFRARHTNTADMASCTACHTGDPAGQGRHVKTGRPIAPVAVSQSPKRFTDRDKVEQRFRRDCTKVLGRECTPAEKGDYIAFMASR